MFQLWHRQLANFVMNAVPPIRCTECVCLICITMDSHSKVSNEFFFNSFVESHNCFRLTPKKKNGKLLEKAENK